MMYRQGSPPPRTADKRCLYCGSGNDWQAAICACGATLPPGQRDEPDPPLRCPRCHLTELTFTPTDPQRYGHHCGTCGGLFVGAKEWTELLATTTTVEAALIDTTEAQPLGSSQLFPLADCPACHATMERATFAARSGISVDVCNMHGIWFDAGELFEVVRWLSEGKPYAMPLNAVVELRLASQVPGGTDQRPENGNDVYSRFAAAGNLLTLRRMFPWR